MYLCPQTSGMSKLSVWPPPSGQCRYWGQGPPHRQPAPCHIGLDLDTWMVQGFRVDPSPLPCPSLSCTYDILTGGLITPRTPPPPPPPHPDKPFQFLFPLFPPRTLYPTRKRWPVNYNDFGWTVQGFHPALGHSTFACGCRRVKGRTPQIRLNGGRWSYFSGAVSKVSLHQTTTTYLKYHPSDLHQI